LLPLREAGVSPLRPALIAEDAGAANLCRKIVLTRTNLAIIGQRFVSTLALFGKLTQVKIGCAFVRDVECHQVLELRLGKGFVVFLQSQDGYRENHIRVVRVGDHKRSNCTLASP
jgi:hypothetical protein